MILNILTFHKITTEFLTLHIVIIVPEKAIFLQIFF